MTQKLSEKLDSIPISDNQRALLSTYQQILKSNGSVSDLPKFAKSILKNKKKIDFSELSLTEASNLMALLQESEAAVRKEVDESLQLLSKMLLEVLIAVLSKKK